MAGTPPIRLGSAVSGWTFEAASSVEESVSGIQTCTVSALWPIGSTVLSNLPAAGASVSTIESTGYIPSSFVLDYTEAGPNIDYIEGQIARVKFKFKRQDPNRTGPTASRHVFADTVLNYDSELFQSTYSVVGLGGTVSGSLTGPNPNKFGFPEPVVTVVYNSTTEPTIAGGNLASLYALPGSANAASFPSAGDLTIPLVAPIPAGSLISYFDGSDYISTQLLVDTVITFELIYKAHPRGWQLTKFKYNPVANRTFFDVEEEWRNYYFAFGARFISAVPPIPP